MIVRCIGNSPTIITGEDAAKNFAESVNLDEIGLTIGQDYMVYGVILSGGFPWFLVTEEPGDEYPVPHFGQFFEVVDDRVPPDWSLHMAGGNTGGPAILPTAWARNPAFLEKLVDGVPEAVASFGRMKEDLLAWHRGQGETQ